MSNRLALYGAVSTLGAAAVIGSALNSRANFFAAAVAIGRSSGALMVLANFAVFLTICFGIVLKTIFFGRLRSIEYEHLFERLWIFLTESLLALTIFRDDFSAPFAFTYGVLLFLKSFHWITGDRIDYMDQVPPPGPPLTFHIRAAIIIAILAVIDIALVIYSLESILMDGVSAMVLFASEFMILLASIGGTLARYVVGLIDLRRARGRADAPSWEEKSMYLFYVDLAVDFAKLLTYLSFFLVILLHYGLPLHILRDVYMTLRSFLSRCSDLIRYRRATKDMDAQYPNATTEDMERNGDKTCIICREEMIARDVAGARAADAANEAVAGGPNETPKKLQCGHIFHFHCLRSWLERQQSCPTCRRDVLRTPAPTHPRHRANGVNVQINPPPPPAPVARPQANGVPVPNPIQAIYDQYFLRPDQQRPPAPGPTAPAANGAASPAPTTAPPTDSTTPASGLMNYPLPDAAAVPGATGIANGPIHAGASYNVDQERLQRGIWGGPIVPGRFFAGPLGAAPSWPPTAVSAYTPGVSTHTRSSGTNMPIIRLPEMTTTDGASSTSTVTPPTIGMASSESGPSNTQSSATVSRPASITGSGTSTPFSSNPPQIFTQTGTTPPELAGVGVEAQSDNANTGLDADVRKAAAEAASRRMGITSSRNRTPGKSVDPIPQVDPNSPSVVQKAFVSNLDAATSEKAKGKLPALHPLDEPSQHLPFLAPLNGATTQYGYMNGVTDLGLGSWSERRAVGSVAPAGEAGEVGVRQALDDRLRLLRDVDEVVWGLVGELTRARSEWEFERSSEG